MNYFMTSEFIPTIFVAIHLKLKSGTTYATHKSIISNKITKITKEVDMLRYFSTENITAPSKVHVSKESEKYRRR